MRGIILLLTLMLTGNASAQGEINVLTDLFSPFPPGCVGLNLPVAPSSADNLLYDETVRAPSIGSATANSDVRVQIWRLGCADDGFSVVMVRLSNQSDNEVLIPRVFVDTSIKQGLLWNDAQLITSPAVGNISASGGILPEAGRTFMLALDPLSLFDEETLFTVDDYNSEFFLELFWGAYAPIPASANPELFVIAEYNPALDPPQFPTPLLHGRMNGAYVFEGKPSAGLFLNIGEQVTNTADGPEERNFVFVAFFTYLGGEPYWLVGSPGPQDPGINEVTIPMISVRGGDFFTNPASYTDADLDVESVGTLGIEVIDCNNLQLDYNFNGIGVGQGQIQAQRLIRVAGYDCNPWTQ
jgi:hypothetical protein